MYISSGELIRLKMSGSSFLLGQVLNTDSEILAGFGIIVPQTLCRRTLKLLGRAKRGKGSEQAWEKL